VIMQQDETSRAVQLQCYLRGRNGKPIPKKNQCSNRPYMYVAKKLIHLIFKLVQESRRHNTLGICILATIAFVIAFLLFLLL
jgi:hypothetical protein